MDQIEKFVRKFQKKLALRVAKALEDVVFLRLDLYDLEKMKGSKNLFRIRIGKIRIIFRKQEGSGLVLSLDYRGGAYRKY